MSRFQLTTCLLADRIGIISKGKLVAVGTVEEIAEKNAVQGDLEDVFLTLTE